MTAWILLQAGQFISWGSEHYAWLLAGVASIFFWIYLGAIQLDERRQRRVGLIMSLIPVVLWSLVSVDMIRNMRPLDIGLVLPFHVCFFLNLLMPVMLWKRSYFLFEITYFMVMGGCLQALLTPDLQTGFPDFMNLRYFIVHIGLVQSTLYAILVYRFRPVWRSFGKAFLWTNIYLVFAASVNALLGTNFMYLSRKPSAPTMLDLFGDWPWYILGGELLALALYLAVFLPFMFRRPQWI